MDEFQKEKLKEQEQILMIQTQIKNQILTLRKKHRQIQIRKQIQILGFYFTK